MGHSPYRRRQEGLSQVGRCPTPFFLSCKPSEPPGTCPYCLSTSCPEQALLDSKENCPHPTHAGAPIRSFSQDRAPH